jgi:hypothetical protein
VDLIMDGLLVAGALFAGTFCSVLSRRVRALKDLDSGIGGAITQMTRALEDARRALEDAKTASRDGRQDLKELITRAEAASAQLRILLAASRDLPQPSPHPQPATPPQSAPPAPPALQSAPDVRERSAAAPAPPAPVAAHAATQPAEAAHDTEAATTLAFAPAPAAANEPRPISPQPAPPPVNAEEPRAAPPFDPLRETALTLPKPRRIFPLEALRPRPRPAFAPPRDEDDLLATLTALAAPGQS